VKIGGIGLLEHEKEVFSFITMSHVIEHLHEPIKTLEDCFRLLQPGGTLWIETPSIKALGYSYFHDKWRGLEAPRHLVLFSPDALKFALQKAGFVSISRQARPIRSLGIFRESWLLEQNLSLASKKKSTFAFKAIKALLVIVEVLWPNRKELITITATKPKE